MNRWRTMACAALGASLIAAWVMAPMLKDAGGTLCAYDHPGDAMISIWSTWVRLGAADGRWSLHHVPLVAAPEGVNLLQSPPEPATEWPQFWLARWVGDVRAYNIHLWLTFPLAAATMALFVWELTHQPAAAIVSGLLYACSPYHFAHTMQLSLASIQWLPLGLWSWVWLAQAPSAKRALGHALCLGLLVWTTAYYGFVFAIASLVTVPILTWQARGIRSRPRRFLGWGLCAVLGTLAVSLGFYRAFFVEAVARLSLTFTERYAWPLKHLFVYSAKPWDYLVPSVHHPWWGRAIAPFVTAHLYGSNVAEQTLYVGYGVLGLAGVAGLAAWRRRVSATTVGVLAAIGLIGLWCSGPPFIPLGPFRIEDDGIVATSVLYFPSMALHQLFPVFRVYARVGLLVLLAGTALAGIGWAQWQQRLSTARHPVRGRIGLVIMAMLLILDYAVAMPCVTVGRPPAVYAWLAQQPGDPLIAEYPFLPSTHAFHAEYLFYQRTHGKRMVNGAFEQTPTGRQRLALADLADPAVPAKLRTLGVQLVIVHADRYAALPARPARIRILGIMYDVPRRHPEEHRAPPPLTLPGLRLVTRFGETAVYAVS